MSSFADMGRCGRSSRVTSAPAVTPVALSRWPCTPPTSISRSISLRSRSCWTPARSSAGIDSASGSNMCLTSRGRTSAGGRVNRLKCGTRKNSGDHEAALAGAPSMADMTTVPDRARVRLPGISSRAYEHPADRSALVAMRKLTGFDVLLSRLAGLFNERSMRLLFLASAGRVSAEHFPQLYELLLDGSAILDLPEVPELFVTQDPQPNAMTLGSDKPFIVLTTGLVDLLDAEEARYVVGHELGHVLSGHAVYRTMLFHLTRLAARLAWFAVGYIGLRGIIAGLEEWYRKSELSCDRAGVLAGEDAGAGGRVGRRSRRPRGAAQAAADAGHHAPVRGGALRRTRPLDGRGRLRDDSGEQLSAPRRRRSDLRGRGDQGRRPVLPGVLEPDVGSVHRAGQGGRGDRCRRRGPVVRHVYSPRRRRRVNRPTELLAATAGIPDSAPRANPSQHSHPRRRLGLLSTTRSSRCTISRSYSGPDRKSVVWAAGVNLPG